MRFNEVYRYQALNDLKINQLALIAGEVHVPPLLGIEVEVENCKSEGVEFLNFWYITAEGSLRNHGVEFTSWPMTLPVARHALDELNTFLKGAGRGKKKVDFSERCSVHIHLDYRNATPEQFLRFLVLYTSFESVLFSFAGPDRQESNYCVPVTDVREYSLLKRHIQECLRNGQPIDPAKFLHDAERVIGGKYSALNIGNLRTGREPRVLPYGTIEFRHMEGNCEVAKIVKWMELIVNLHDASQRLTMPEIEKVIREINTTSQYEQYVQMVFGNLIGALVPRYTHNWKTLEASVTRTKEFFTPLPQGVPEFLISPIASKLQGRIDTHYTNISSPNEVFAIYDEAVPQQIIKKRPERGQL